MENLKLENTITETLKFIGWAQQYNRDDRIVDELEITQTEIIQAEQQRDKQIRKEGEKAQTLKDPWDNTKIINICIMKGPTCKEKEYSAQKVFQETMAKTSQI